MFFLRLAYASLDLNFFNTTPSLLITSIGRMLVTSGLFASRELRVLSRLNAKRNEGPNQLE